MAEYGKDFLLNCLEKSVSVSKTFNSKIELRLAITKFIQKNTKFLKNKVNKENIHLPLSFKLHLIKEIADLKEKFGHQTIISIHVEPWK